MFGQDEPYDEVIYYGTDETPPLVTEEWPSETRYIQTYQEQQEAIQAKVEGGGGFFDILKSVIGLATPIYISKMRAEHPTATALPKTSTGLPVKTASIGGALGSLISNPLLLAGLGIGGYLFLRKRGRK